MTDLVKNTQYTPKQMSTDLMETIKDIEGAIRSSGIAITKVEGRGLFKTIFSSSNSDLVAISKSQNKINELMLSLIQEIITLNVMSYSYLAAVLAEFHKSIKEGWTDSEGRFQELSESGEVFANTASNIFEKIIEGSRATQEKIELNSSLIEGLQQFLKEKDALDEQQSQDIVNLKSALRDKSSMLEQQSQQIRSLTESLEREKNLIHDQSKQMEGIRRLLEQQKSVDEQLTLTLAGFVEDLQYKEVQGVSRDNSIITINNAIDCLQNRYKILSAFAGVAGLGVVLLTIAVGLVIFDIL